MYVLQSLKDADLYTGSTNDLKRRLKEHNAGEVQSTKSRTPFRVIYYEAYLSEDDARNREQQLKLRGQALIHLKNRIKKSFLQD